MKFGSNYASLRIPYGVPLKVIQFRFGEYETSDPTEIEILTNHSETFRIGGDTDGQSGGNGNKTPKPRRTSGNTRKRTSGSESGQ
ncbi:hypothetical protein GCM10025857_14910 [Alicyclobacillus contaminans]|nr:hypothetical protein GCM10025857_14910 [Alicyclobacillus contaminans]